MIVICRGPGAYHAAVTGTDAEQERHGRRRGAATVTTIARLAGVSVPTVSKVLNGRDGVAPETRRRVEAILREQGYRRPEAVGPVAVLEVAFHALESHLAIEIMRGVERVAGQRRLAVGFTETRGRSSAGQSRLEQVLSLNGTACAIA